MMRSRQNVSSTCLFCKRKISDHSRGESIECALKLCNGNEAVDTCGIDGQLTRNQPTATKEFSR